MLPFGKEPGDRLNGMKRLRTLLVLVLLVCVPPLVGVHAQDPAGSNAAATPALTPRPKPKPSPTPDPSVPVGTVNGFAVYRPLLKSEVSDPVSRALIIYDFNRHNAKLPDARIDAAARDYIRTHFNNDDTKLDAKLKTLGATRADFREFVAEESKVHLMLANVSRGSVSDEGAKRIQQAYIATLRQHASINTPKS